MFSHSFCSDNEIIIRWSWCYQNTEGFESVQKLEKVRNGAMKLATILHYWWLSCPVKKLKISLLTVKNSSVVCFL